VETVEQIIMVALKTLKDLIEFYIPVETIKATKADFFSILVSLLSKEGISKDPIADALFNFIANKDHIQEALKWLDTGRIADSTNDSLYEIGFKHKYTIVKVVFKSTEFDYDFKQQLLEKTIGEDKSDIALNTRVTC